MTDTQYDPNTSPALAAFFNRRFELYGRHIRLIPRANPGEEPIAERAAARAVYEQDQAFASTIWVSNSWDYFDELARLRIMGVLVRPLSPETYLASRRPYLWTYAMATDRQFALAGDWYCARFTGRNAVHAGDPLLQTTRRKPGIILTELNWEGVSAEPMRTRMASCGEHPDVIRGGGAASVWDSYYVTFMQNAMLQMKTSGVTTVACLCELIALGHGMRGSTNQGYFPEWLVTSFQANDLSGVVKLVAPAEQLESLMLLLEHPMLRRYFESPSVWAVQEGRTDGNAGTTAGPDYAYWPLLLLASGIQMAGPNLTPETFERGLHQTRFPNPAHRIMAGAVGFSDGDHSMTDDGVEVWWSNTGRSPIDETPGTFCYVDGGARRRIGSFPTDDPFFKGVCDNGAL